MKARSTPNPSLAPFTSLPYPYPFLDNPSPPFPSHQIVRENPSIKAWFSGHFHLSHDYEDSITFPGGNNRGSCVFAQVGLCHATVTYAIPLYPFLTASAKHRCTSAKHRRTSANPGAKHRGTNGLSGCLPLLVYFSLRLGA
jgi:hypothetical protein